MKPSELKKLLDAATIEPDTHTSIFITRGENGLRIGTREMLPLLLQLWEAADSLIKTYSFHNESRLAEALAALDQYGKGGGDRITCPVCGGLIVKVSADEPYHEAYLLCVRCDSTFVEEGLLCVECDSTFVEEEK